MIRMNGYQEFSDGNLRKGESPRVDLKVTIVPVLWRQVFV